MRARVSDVVGDHGGVAEARGRPDEGGEGASEAGAGGVPAAVGDAYRAALRSCDSRLPLRLRTSIAVQARKPRYTHPRRTPPPWSAASPSRPRRWLTSPEMAGFEDAPLVR